MKKSNFLPKNSNKYTVSEVVILTCTWWLYITGVLYNLIAGRFLNIDQDMIHGINKKRKQLLHPYFSNVI